MGRKYTLPTEAGKEGTHSIKGNLCRYINHINHTQKTLHLSLIYELLAGVDSF